MVGPPAQLHRRGRLSRDEGAADKDADLLFLISTCLLLCLSRETGGEQQRMEEEMWNRQKEAKQAEKGE